VTYFKAKFFNPNGEIIQTLYTELKGKEKAKEEYLKSVSKIDSFKKLTKSVSDHSKVGAIVTTASKGKFKSDAYTIEMGNKPEGTKYIDVELKYSETLKTEYRLKERLFTMTVPRYKKTRYEPLFADDIDDDGAPDINGLTRWIDEIEIIEPSSSEYDAYQILNSRKT
jgi:hypothetical protein